jgi:hypothetical protein
MTIIHIIEKNKKYSITVANFFLITQTHNFKLYRLANEKSLNLTKI